MKAFHAFSSALFAFLFAAGSALADSSGLAADAAQTVDTDMSGPTILSAKQLDSVTGGGTLITVEPSPQEIAVVFPIFSNGVSLSTVISGTSGCAIALSCFVSADGSVHLADVVTFSPL